MTSATAQSAEQATEASASPQIAVYLAEPAKGLETEDITASKASCCNSITASCRINSCRWTPKSQLLRARCVATCSEEQLFVHLIGAKYGVRPDGDDRSIPHIQYDLAAKLDEQRQIVWLKPDQTPENKHQEEFIARIKNHSPNYWQTKLLEDLKATIQKKLQPPAANGWEADDESTRSMSASTATKRI